MRNFRAVLFDWRGTLALTMSGPQWIQEGFCRLHLVSALLGWPPFACRPYVCHQTGANARVRRPVGVPLPPKVRKRPPAKAGVAGPDAAALSPDDAT